MDGGIIVHRFVAGGGITLQPAHSAVKPRYLPLRYALRQVPGLRSLNCDYTSLPLFLDFHIPHNGRTLHAHAEREDTEGGLHVCILSRNRCFLSQWSCGELKRASTTAWLDSNSSHCNFLRLAAKHCALQIGVRAV
jgi:hypothetical protein